MAHYFFVGLISAFVLLPDFGLAKDADENNGSDGTTSPNIYLDLHATYASVPSNALALGFRTSLSLPTLSVSTLPSQNTSISVPLTVDLTDRISLYGGINTFAAQYGTDPWSSMTVTSWFFGFQADVFQQNGSMIPTITWQSNWSHTLGGIISAASISNIVEFDYAMNEHQTKGLLAGIKYSTVSLNTGLLHVEPAIVGYAGGYYQWESNWKLSGRFGVQSFGGANLGNVLQLKPFTMPIIRLDLDRMDDDDNRLFGLTAEVAWTPSATFQMTLRTPLYFAKN